MKPLFVGPGSWRGFSARLPESTQSVDDALADGRAPLPVYRARSPSEVRELRGRICVAPTSDGAQERQLAAVGADAATATSGVCGGVVFFFSLSERRRARHHLRVVANVGRARQVRNVCNVVRCR